MWVNLSCSREKSLLLVWLLDCWSSSLMCCCSKNVYVIQDLRFCHRVRLFMTRFKEWRGTISMLWWFQCLESFSHIQKDHLLEVLWILSCVRILDSMSIDDPSRLFSGNGTGDDQIRERFSPESEETLLARRCQDIAFARESTFFFFWIDERLTLSLRGVESSWCIPILESSSSAKLTTTIPPPFFPWAIWDVFSSLIDGPGSSCPGRQWWPDCWHLGHPHLCRRIQCLGRPIRWSRGRLVSRTASLILGGVCMWQFWWQRLRPCRHWRQSRQGSARRQRVTLVMWTERGCWVSRVWDLGALPDDIKCEGRVMGLRCFGCRWSSSDASRARSRLLTLILQFRIWKTLTWDGTSCVKELHVVLSSMCWNSAFEVQVWTDQISSSSSARSFSTKCRQRCSSRQDRSSRER